MIHDDAVKARIYQEMLTAVHARVASILQVPETEVDLSLGRALNLLFLLRGQWGDIGEYLPSIQAVHDLVGTRLLWLDPKEAAATTVAQVPTVQ